MLFDCIDVCDVRRTFSTRLINYLLVSLATILYNFSLPQAYVTLADFGYFFSPFGCIAPKHFKLLGFPIFDFRRTWWRLSQKRVVRTFDIYIFIKGSTFILYYDDLYNLHIIHWNTANVGVKNQSINQSINQ